jgi:hypothetical protein
VSRTVLASRITAPISTIEQIAPTPNSMSSGSYFFLTGCEKAFYECAVTPPTGILSDKDGHQDSKTKPPMQESDFRT